MSPYASNTCFVTVEWHSNPIVGGLTIVLLIISAVSCGPTPTRHPTAINIVPDSELASVIGRHRANSEVNQDLLNAVTWFGRFRHTSSIGAASGPDMFGRIQDLTTDESGHLLILDSRLNDVRVTKKNGSLEHRFGHGERGTTVLNTPSSVLAAPGGLIVVGDRPNSIKMFERGEIGYDLTEDLEMELMPEDLCLLGERLFVRGWTKHGEELIHEYSLSGRYLNSIGNEYKDDAWVVRFQLSQGFMACSDEYQIIVDAFAVLPFIRGFSTTGELLWTSRLEDFTHIPIHSGERQNDGRSFVREQPGTLPNEQIVALEPAVNGFVVLQTRLRLADGEQARMEIHTYLISSATGGGVYVGSDFPLIRHITQEHLFAVIQEPYPSVSIYSAERNGASDDYGR